MSSHIMNDDELLRGYLLGRLDEEQASEVERRLLEDGELFELAEAVEGDLMIEAVHGSLSPAERRQVRRLAASPEGRTRYALVRELALLGRETPAVVPFPRFLAQPAVRAAALAASLAVMAGGGLFLATHIAVPGDEYRADINRWNQRDHPPEAPRPLQREDEVAQAPAPQAPPPDLSRPREPVPAPLPRPELGPLVFQLALSGVRGGDEGVPRLQVPPERRTVEIRLPLDPDMPSTSFDVVLRNAVSNEEIRRDKALAAQVVDGERVLRLTVPAASLAPGTYEVYVESQGEGEEREFLGSPIFEVAMP